ncbi:MAG: STAS domain-containing protein [Pseudomonadota bacterium]
MEHQIKRQGERLLISFSGRIDQQQVSEFKMPLAMAEASRAPEVVLDFSAVSYIGSMGIAVMVQFYKGITARGGRMSLVNLSPNIAEMFRALKLHQFFNLA